jgi:hypothetical protein
MKLKIAPKMMGKPVDIVMYNSIGEVLKKWNFINDSLNHELVLPESIRKNGIYFFKFSNSISNQVIKVANQQ